MNDLEVPTFSLTSTTMAFRASSPTNRALEIPELLDMIFRYLDNSCNVANARVCKRWSEIALDSVWRDLDDLYHLFAILKPLKPTSDKPDAPLEFTAPPDADDWKRAERYSRRVKRLVYHASCSFALCPTVFEVIARTRTSLVVLPNTRSIAWEAPLHLLVMFMHANVKHFVVRLDGQHELTPHSPFFRDVVSRMPSITNLDIHCETPAAEVVLPRFFLTTRIAECAAKLADLECLEFQYDPEQGFGDPSDIEVFRPALGPGSYPSLGDLSLTVSLGDIVRLMKQPSCPANLTSLLVDSRLFETPEVVYEFLTTLSESCQLLETLSIITVVSDEEPIEKLDAIPRENRMSFSTIRPLQHLPSLTVFDITHQYPMDLAEDELEQLARSWPSLKKLILNNEPMVLDSCSLTLASLLPFARHCPELEKLVAEFAKLQSLSMGVSLIDEDGPVALFLSKICPLDTQLESGVTWDLPASGHFEPEVHSTVRDRCNRWNKVAETLPLLTNLRMEERARTSKLEAEVDDLRMRSQVILDKPPIREDSCVVC
ncbi:unnamed protein product [Mycena citricolor]|uniref:F-box domain-containing protein n=1 Tax=Mycena citricolor TaxID=2018698 RepID=A0AAD2H750_9AGAR|nr:unnamed protein product [Mycena citricolor]